LKICRCPVNGGGLDNPLIYIAARGILQGKSLPYNSIEHPILVVRFIGIRPMPTGDPELRGQIRLPEYGRADRNEGRLEVSIKAFPNTTKLVICVWTNFVHLIVCR